jgi:predicted PurR-regulated permease PerM
MKGLEDRALLMFVIVVSIAFGWVISPFYGAILWAIVAAIVFAPFNRRLAGVMPRWPNTTALATLIFIVALVIVPAIMIGTSLVQEILNLYVSIQSNELDIGQRFAEVQKSLPVWMTNLLDRLGLTDVDQVSERFSNGIANVVRILAKGALDIGQSAFSFFVGMSVMLYLAFFLLRDGQQLSKQISRAIPLLPEQKFALFEKFATVIRATIKGSIVVAVLQGLIGGVIFWFLGIHAALLWGVLMGFLSLLPAIGTGLVWVPVAAYLLLTGSIWQGLVLVFCGLFVIGMVDNILRPILVGKDTRMPDYVVLISTLGGIGVFGVNGFILGPIVAALFMAAWDIFGRSRTAKAS